MVNVKNSLVFHGTYCKAALYHHGKICKNILYKCNMLPSHWQEPGVFCMQCFSQCVFGCRWVMGHRQPLPEQPSESLSKPLLSINLCVRVE